MKINHESPKALFEASKAYNDYPYVLGHLLALDEDYKAFCIEELRKADFSILDNSAFELNSSISDEELMTAARELKPSHLVLPDTINDQKKTLTDSYRFLVNNLTELKLLGITPIGVVQGNTIEELYECVERFKEMGITFIAIPCHRIPGADNSSARSQFFKYMVEKLGEEGMSQLQIHFLGIESPQELLTYTSQEKKFIHSIDTSSPILHGILGNMYHDHGCDYPKPKIKLADNLDIEVSEVQLDVINWNIQKFRELTK